MNGSIEHAVDEEGSSIVKAYRKLKQPTVASKGNPGDAKCVTEILEGRK